MSAYIFVVFQETNARKFNEKGVFESIKINLILRVYV